MASIWEKNISILRGNLNSGRSYLITAVALTKNAASESFPTNCECVSIKANTLGMSNSDPNIFIY